MKWFSYIVTAFMMYSFFTNINTGQKRIESLAVVRQLRLKMFLLSVPVIAVVLAVVVLLLQIPILKFSWLNLLPQSASAASGSNLTLIGLQNAWIAPIFLIFLIMALPRFAMLEEETFREDTEGWISGLKRSLVFGMVHCIFGVSLGVGLALTIAGLWFTYQYFKGGVIRSAAYHLSYNLTILSVVTVALIAKYFV